MQHVTGSDFKGALAWLADRFGPGAAAADLTARLRAQAVSDVKAAVAEREPFTPPQPAPEHWQHVREHLTKARALPGGYIDRLHELGDLYADAKRNAVFVCRDPETNRITGAEIKGTLPRPDGSRFTGMAPGSRKDGGGFRVGDIARAATVYLVESAIDAISLFQAAAGCRRTGPRSRFDRWNHPRTPDVVCQAGRYRAPCLRFRQRQGRRRGRAQTAPPQVRAPEAVRERLERRPESRP